MYRYSWNMVHLPDILHSVMIRKVNIMIRTNLFIILVGNNEFWRNIAVIFRDVT